MTKVQPASAENRKPDCAGSLFRIYGSRIGFNLGREVEKIPRRISSPLQIMLEAPIGSASFNNEFGRPNIGGYFRTFETSNRNRTSWFGFHKPIMFAGGIGNISPFAY